jgi:hypothetical protein
VNIEAVHTTTEPIAGSTRLGNSLTIDISHPDGHAPSGMPYAQSA